MKTATSKVIEKKVDEIIAGFLSYLKKEDELTLLPSIVAKLESEVKASSDKGEVITAIKLEDEQVRQIEEIMVKKLNRPVHLTNVVKNDILGGLIIRFNDILIDLSLKTQLAEIQRQVYT